MERPENESDPTITPTEEHVPSTKVRAEPDRGLVIILDAAGRERPYLVTKAEALMVLELSKDRPGWVSAAEMRKREPRIYNPAVILARLRGKGLTGFRIETDAGKRMRLVIDWRARELRRREAIGMVAIQPEGASQASRGQPGPPGNAQ